MVAEGIVAKRLDSPYQMDTRFHDWLKWKAFRRAEYTILALREETFAPLVGEPGRPVAMVELGWRPDDRRALYGLLGGAAGAGRKGPGVAAACAKVPERNR